MRPPRDEPITALALQGPARDSVSCGDRRYAILPAGVLAELRRVWNPTFNEAPPKDWGTFSD
eukprot:1320089-Pyramimonas_sp.AAC.1